MKFSEQYGPQFDEKDGTIGEIQLVKRWIVCKKDGFPFYPRQGRYTFKTKREAENRIEAVQSNYPPNINGLDELEAKEWWCYPNHFDPNAPVPEVS